MTLCRKWEKGDLLEEYSCDACFVRRNVAKAGGTRRNPSDWSYTNVHAPTYINRGFTGHEHLDMLDLIHMNGRIYDPEISRFLSPDPVIQDPYNILKYNRYSYCLNNPLKYTDPSGFILQVDDPPEMKVLNPGWFKYAESTNLAFYNPFDFLDGRGTASGGSEGRALQEPNKITWDKDSKVWRNSDGSFATDEQINAARGLISALDFAPKQDFSGFFGFLKFVLTEGYIDGYQYNLKGEAVRWRGFMYIGFAPSTGGIKGGFGAANNFSKVLQSGGQSLTPKTLNALKLTKEQGRNAIHALKSELRLPNNFHGKIMGNGDYLHPSTGEWLGNLFDYVY